jgi:signal peptidase I
MFFLTPRYIKEAKQYLQGAQKFLAYKRDILAPSRVSEIEVAIEELRSAMRKRSREGVAKDMRHLDELIGKSVPPVKNSGLRENIEVLVVAIVFAAGVKAYFLQPFRIPTGSMQPTLYGIVGVPTENPTPSLLVRAFDLVVRGRHHLDLRAQEEDVVVALEEKTYLNFFTFTKIVCRRHSYMVFAPRDPLMRYFRVLPGREYAAGEVIARGHVDTGDQIFVNKVVYNFTKPKRGDVFVFKTTDIREIEAGLDPKMGSQHYIKRLAGLPGDSLRIDPPNLFIDEKTPTQPVFERVMSMKDGYQGYSNGGQSGPPFRYLGSTSATFTVPPRSYFALGDNSYHSRDSRDWGIVPERNVAGQGFFVYWPFSSRWGFIH